MLRVTIRQGNPLVLESVQKYKGSCPNLPFFVTNCC